MLNLLREIRNTQVTKDDFIEYGQGISKQFAVVDERITKNSTAISSIESRLKAMESKIDDNRHDNELAKQNVIQRNLSIMGIPPLENEDLKKVVLKLFSKIGCQVSDDDVFGCYRVKKGRTAADIIVVKLNDYELKRQILLQKTKTEIKLCDVCEETLNGPNGNVQIYINPQQTPFFGRLMAEGRQQVKAKKIHSVRLTNIGCRLRFEENGEERLFRSVKELHSLISSNADAKVNHKRTRSDDGFENPNRPQRRRNWK